VTDETLEAATAGRVSDVSEPAPAAEPGTREDSWLDQARRSTAFWIGLVIVAIAIIFGAITPGHSFVKPENMLAIGLNASMIMLLGVGMTYLIGAGHLDLSVGYNLILASVLASKTMVALGGTALEVQSGAYPNLALALTAGIIVAIGSGMAIGTLNGLLVTRLRLSSFIVTLATSGIAYGLSLVLTSAANIPYIPDQLQTEFGGAKLLGIVPFPLILALVVSAVFWIILRRTRFGLRTLAIGSSRDAALRAGINVNAHTLRLFIQMGALVGLAALVDISRNANTNVAGHQTDNLQAIAAVVIGGTSLFGGVASIGGTLLGTLIPVMLANGLVQMATNPFYQYALVGIILILAVYFDQRRRERST
jgi:ribose transport system permease protein